jgi:hypothetical protein
MRRDRDSRGRWRVVAALAVVAVVASLLPGVGAPGSGGMPPAAAATGALTPAALDGPAVGSWGGGRLDLFFRDSRDGHLAHQWYVPGSAWTAPQSLGGTLTSQPAVASWAPRRYDVFVRGSDGAVWHKWFNGRWSAWESLGGLASSSPAVATWAAGRLDVFIRGGGNALWHKWFNGRWSAWQSLGGTLSSGPAAVSWGPGRIDVLARGGGNALWHKWYSGGWSAWQALWTRSYNVTGSGWSAWARLGGTLTSGPSAAVPRAGALAVFVRGTDGHFYYRERSASLTWLPGWRVVDPAVDFRYLGAWVDTFDYAALTPATAVADLKAHRVRTLYLGTARYNSATDILFPSDVAAWLAAAHAAGLRVVGWYVPDYADLTRDVRRTLAIASYVSPAGDRFDAVGIDIEYPLNPPNVDAWNQAVASHLAQVRAGTSRPIVAIVLPPVLMTGWPDPNRWARFPWASVGRYASAVAPMSYWTSFTPASRCAAGDPQYCAYRYSRDNVLLSRQLTGLPVHVIGGIGDKATVAEVSDYVRAARETAAFGGSLYDYLTTKAEFWPYLQQLTP